MNFKRLFFIEGKFYGEGLHKASLLPGFASVPSSYVVCCQTCGEVFARIPLLRADGSTSTWMPVSRLCRKCPAKYPWDTPGSLWLDWDEAFVNSFPAGVLQWELLRNAEAYEKQPL